MDPRGRIHFGMVSKIIVSVEFDDSVNVCSEYDHCRLIWYVSDVMTHVGLNFCFVSWDRLFVMLI